VRGFFYKHLRKRLLPDLRRAWTRDVEASFKEARKAIASLQAEVETLRRQQRALLLAESDRQNADVLRELESRLSIDEIRAHVTDAIDRAGIGNSPMPHMIIEPIFPPDFYALLVRALPPAALFPQRDPIKQDFEIAALDDAPALTQRVWRYLDEEVVGGVLTPALSGKFHRCTIEHYAETGGRSFGERAASIAHRNFTGRIQLRRPGYLLKPHLDPKRVVITGLLYLARPGDGESFGTQLVGIDRPCVASGMKTFFPDQAGFKTELTYTVPFKPNTLLAFVNSRGAHGAELPPDAPLRERYTYQFYIKPDDGALKGLLRELPDDARASWAGLE
jgi:hypothetical protein